MKTNEKESSGSVTTDASTNKCIPSFNARGVYNMNGDIICSLTFLQSCGHECCKNGIPVKDRNPSQSSSSSGRQAMFPPPVNKPLTTERRMPRPPAWTGSLGKRSCDTLGGYLSEVHSRRSSIPETPALKRLKVCSIEHNSGSAYKICFCSV